MLNRPAGSPARGFNAGGDPCYPRAVEKGAPLTRPWLLVPPEGARIIDTGAARWWIEDGVIFNQSYIAGSVTGDHIRAGFAASRELGGGRRRPLLAEAGPLADSTREARDLLAGPEAAAVFSGMGVLVDSPVARTIMNLFIRVSSPPFEVRMFTSADEARAWARKLVIDG
jgi:hypothetical protein